jgi:hypothetical protein
MFAYIFIGIILALYGFLYNMSETIIVKNEKTTKENIYNLNIKNPIHIKETLKSFYKENYSKIHGINETSNFLLMLTDNIDYKYIFNSEKICKIKRIDDKIENCINSKKINTLFVGISNENIVLFNNLISIIGENNFLEINKELLLNFNNKELPYLIFNFYGLGKAKKPDLKNFEIIDTRKILFNKIFDTKDLLDRIANSIQEDMKRNFKGYVKSDVYANKNIISTLGEAIYENEVFSKLPMGYNSGFQTSDYFDLGTEWMTTGSYNNIKNYLSEFGGDINCVVSPTGQDCELYQPWYKLGYNFQFKINNRYKNSVNTPNYYCSLNDTCGLIIPMDENEKIDGSGGFNLEDIVYSLSDFMFLKFGLRIDNWHDVFITNETLLENGNFILSSSNGGRLNVTSLITLSLGIRIINRNATLKEDNYIINNYNINYN